MLLNGVTPKELVHSLNITLNTFKTHQKNLYRKLNVSNSRQLIAKFSSNPAFAEQGAWQTDSYKPAAFSRWRAFQDDFGSVINVTPTVEQIRERYIETYTIAGNLSSEPTSYTGVTAEPDDPTLMTMKKSSSFSFTVLGDGNSYKAIITTTDTRKKSDGNHYRKVFTTKKYEISTVSVYLNELVQSPLYGTPVPFNQKNIELLQLQAHSTGDFNLKIWDIVFYP